MFAFALAFRGTDQQLPAWGLSLGFRYERLECTETVMECLEKNFVAKMGVEGR
jgi:hypothetical protein